MKTAEEWNQQIEDAMNRKGGFDTPDEVIAFIKQIQLDALHEAARVASDDSHLVYYSSKHTRKGICDAILSLANNLTNGGSNDK